ncbi:MAG: phosphonate transport system permease protein [Acetobacteraceae bacterium]|jgi:phosphonate transport system permease protein|nr:phosphonate transport system permease protein [Acetobacteraceae bacterium]
MSGTSIDITSERARYPEAFRGKGWLRWLLLTGVFAYLFYLMWLFDFSRVLSSLPKVWVILRLMLDWSNIADWDHVELWRSMLETVAMAYLGTMLAVVFAIPLGFLGARNIIPLRVFRFFARRLFDGLRGLDQLIWALVFVRAMGLGPIAGIMAIAVAETGVLAKLFSEAVENIDGKQVESITSVGAGFVARLRFAVLPQVLPVMISQALYSIESNSREATILGLVGAGGIGLRLSERIQINAWDQVAYIIVLILISVAAIDTTSRYLRLRLIGVANT